MGYASIGLVYLVKTDLAWYILSLHYPIANSFWALLFEQQQDTRKTKIWVLFMLQQYCSIRNDSTVASCCRFCRAAVQNSIFHSFFISSLLWLKVLGKVSMQAAEVLVEIFIPFLLFHVQSFYFIFYFFFSCSTLITMAKGLRRLQFCLL